MAMEIDSLKKEVARCHNKEVLDAKKLASMKTDVSTLTRQLAEQKQITIRTQLRLDTTLLELEDSHKISQLAIEAKEKAEALSLKNAGQLDEVRERAIKKGIVIQTSQESREQHWLDMERRWREREGWLGAEVVVIRDAEDEERKRLEEAKRMKEEEEARERKKKEEEEEA
eukprot:gnl/Carplike_NY0171/2444_a3285_741.p1 GENE.gnl/Carplike_NY0171/2444_a3285_741~~gnl/Carplike_NY0171/2444_a3285_741.p1  ORF type:complete len:182 (-),score=66.88 gnl/Carplike_NY0171/2444_a3285_741:91-603(-)